MHGIMIKEGVLISGVVLYTSLCNWDRAWCPDSRRCPHFRGVLIEGFHSMYYYTTVTLLHCNALIKMYTHTRNNLLLSVWASVNIIKIREEREGVNLHQTGTS